jgi:hypothetical protein
MVLFVVNSQLSLSVQLLMLTFECAWRTHGPNGVYVGQGINCIRYRYHRRLVHAVVHKAIAMFLQEQGLAYLYCACMSTVLLLLLVRMFSSQSLRGARSPMELNGDVCKCTYIYMYICRHSCPSINAIGPAPLSMCTYVREGCVCK